MNQLQQDLETRFTYHPPSSSQATLYNEIRDEAYSFALHVVHVCPESRELSLAVTAIEEAVMWANAALARRS